MRFATGLAVLLLMALAPGVADAAPTPKVVVVPSQGKGGPNIKSQISSLLEKGLKQTAAIISFDKYIKAAKAAGVRSRSLTGPEAVVPASRGVGATHVLIVESISDRVSDGKKKKTGYFASVTLVDAVTGETLLNKRYALDASKKLSSATASEIVGDVVPRFEPKLTAPAPAPEPPPPPPPPPPPSAAQQPMARTPPPASRAPAPPAAPVQEDAFGAEPAFAPPPDANGDTPPPPPDAMLGEAGETSESGEPAGPPPKRRESWRPGFHVNIGEVVFFRDARLTSLSTPSDTPPCYCERNGTAPPAFGRTQLQLELYPFAFTGVGDWWEGWGLHAEGSVGSVRTNLGHGIITSNTVGGGGGGLTYRLVLWESLIATDIQFRGGYNAYSQPLYGAQFPGTSYRSPYFGLYINQPINDIFSIFAGTNFNLYVIGYGGTAALGVQTSPGLGVHAELGARALLLNLLEIKINGLFDQWNLKTDTRADSKLVGADPEYKGLGLTDRYWGFMIAAGIVI